MPEDRSGIDFHCQNTRKFMVFVVTVQYKDEWNLNSTETVPRQPREEGRHDERKALRRERLDSELGSLYFESRCLSGTLSDSNLYPYSDVTTM